MTSNQIAYQNFLEMKRNNISQLAETNRHNIAAEKLGVDTLSETRRHNVRGENIDLSRLGEARRHNVQTESIDLSKLSESTRHNKVTEDVSRRQTDIQAQQAVTQSRAQLEQARHNIQEEKLQLGNLNKELQKLTLQGLDISNNWNIRNKANEIQSKYNDAMVEINRLNSQNQFLGNAKSWDQWERQLKLGLRQLNEAIRNNQANNAMKAVDTATNAATSILNFAFKLPAAATASRR